MSNKDMENKKLIMFTQGRNRETEWRNGQKQRERERKRDREREGERDREKLTHRDTQKN